MKAGAIDLSTATFTDLMTAFQKLPSTGQDELRYEPKQLYPKRGPGQLYLKSVPESPSMMDKVRNLPFLAKFFIERTTKRQAAYDFVKSSISREFLRSNTDRDLAGTVMRAAGLSRGSAITIDHLNTIATHLEKLRQPQTSGPSTQGPVAGLAPARETGRTAEDGDAALQEQRFKNDPKTKFIQKGSDLRAVVKDHGDHLLRLVQQNALSPEEASLVKACLCADVYDANRYKGSSPTGPQFACLEAIGALGAEERPGDISSLRDRMATFVNKCLETPIANVAHQRQAVPRDLASSKFEGKLDFILMRQPVSFGAHALPAPYAL